MTGSDLERRIAELEAALERQREEPTTHEPDAARHGFSRRTLLKGLGIAGLGSYAIGTASADPQGQLGTFSRPVRIVYTERLAGGLTGGETITSILGPGLYVDDEGTLRATILDATNIGDGDTVFADVQDGTLRFRSIDAGRNVTITERDDEIEIEASDSNTNNDGTNVGSGKQIYKGKSGSDLEFRTITTQGALSATENTDTVDIGGPWEDGDGDNLLEPRSGTGYEGIDLTGVSNAKVVTPWVGTTDATDFEIYNDNSLAGSIATEANDLNGNTSGGNVLLGHYSQAKDGAVGVSVTGGGSPVNSNENVAYDDYGTIGGGSSNVTGTNDATDNDIFATVSGGFDNTASGQDSAIGGGGKNTASAFRATVGGGGDNTASTQAATVGGGEQNTAKGNDQSTVAGGYNNTADGERATVGGGWQNEVTAKFATIAGGGPTDTNNPSTTNNAVFDNYGTIAGGGGNQAGDDNGDQSSNPYATVGGGFRNTASGQDSTIGGGSDNTASAFRTFVGGGNNNTASGDYATVPGGRENTASGTHSTAFGRQATANDNGAFVIGDSSSTSISSNGTDELRSQIPMYAPSFNSTSARAKKTAIESVRPASVLETVSDLDVYTWELRETDDGRHMGPMAEDFHEAFDLGDDETIATVDADGVALAAVKGVADRVEDLERDLERKDDRIDDLDAELAEREARIEELESRLASTVERVDHLSDHLAAYEEVLDECDASA